MSKGAIQVHTRGYLQSNVIAPSLRSSSAFVPGRSSSSRSLPNDACIIGSTLHDDHSCDRARNLLTRPSRKERLYSAVFAHTVLCSISRSHAPAAVSSTIVALHEPHSQSRLHQTLDLRPAAHSQPGQPGQTRQGTALPALHARYPPQGACTASYARLRSTGRCSCLAWTCWAAREERGVACAESLALVSAKSCSRSSGVGFDRRKDRRGRSGRRMSWVVWRARLRSFPRMCCGVLVVASFLWPCAKMVATSFQQGCDL